MGRAFPRRRHSDPGSGRFMHTVKQVACPGERQFVNVSRGPPHEISDDALEVVFQRELDNPWPIRGG